mmetsp:Transcript_53136/g.119255  ORF Transcript_53136/g.119255 Transcript_53136/m.119255 type:complete len:323 (-) Transcript_53136:424-1392(-)|eukprot:CAMPEP_0181218062 /NCGR_PEP_ID=MMETSP1096-20121128/27486_1 /TAXON_ID=156174 ORGANISM="Chrysochromulina ericina, Strain CCMP281" /NCGR_SAMPLE_ID=MMETSP1096 /ASSEMBLY_ACC=CAM_ASM_000453 /LENGTH=322 /DNA_ID=CAMNT_0023310239 /DNA_START=109 /DNA_END=1077 /DNA_ORIENTATION=-
MGCASSTASKADKQPPHTLTWPNLTVRVGWTEFDIKKCALLMTVTDEEGKVLMTLRGNTADRGSVCEFFVDGERTYHSDWRTTGTEQDPVKERFIVQDEDSTELFIHRGMELIKATKVWLRMNDAMASLPAAIAVRATRGRISVFKGADAAGDNDLIASIITKGTPPLGADGNQEVSGDMLFHMVVEPKMLQSVKWSERERLLFLAICTDPFWTRGEFGVFTRGASARKQAACELREAVSGQDSSLIKVKIRTAEREGLSSKLVVGAERRLKDLKRNVKEARRAETRERKDAKRRPTRTISDSKSPKAAAEELSSPREIVSV